MDLSSTQHLPAQTQKPSSNVKADQLVWRFLRKVVSVVADARIISEEVQDPQDALARPSSDHDEAASAPTQSIDTAGTPTLSPAEGAPTSSAGKPARLEVDKWFNLESSTVDTFKPTLDIFKHISTTFPITPVETAIEPPPLIVQVLLSLPQPLPDGQVLILNSGGHQTRIENSPRYILLESWRVDIQRVPESHDAPSSTSASPGLSASESSSFEDLSLPGTYKQCITLFRSLYTLLRILPAWRLHRQLREMRAGSGGGMTLEMRVGVPSTSSSATASIMDLAPTIDGSAIVDFDHALSEQHPSTRRVQSMALPSVPSPLGDLSLSLNYCLETDFTLKSIPSSDLAPTNVEADRFSQPERASTPLNQPSNGPIAGTQINRIASTESFSTFPNLTPNYSISPASTSHARSPHVDVLGTTQPLQVSTGEEVSNVHEASLLPALPAPASPVSSEGALSPKPTRKISFADYARLRRAKDMAKAKEMEKRTPSNLGSGNPGTVLESKELSRPDYAAEGVSSAKEREWDSLNSILFNGDEGECERFVLLIREAARNHGKPDDPMWPAVFASTRLGGDALRWYRGLDEDTQNSWDLLAPALLNKFSGPTLDGQLREKTGQAGWGSSTPVPAPGSVLPRLPGESEASKPYSPTLDEPLSTPATALPPLPLETRFDRPRDGSPINGSRVESSVPQEIDLLQELASIESNSTPSTKDIVDLILALGRAIPKAIRNKHQLYGLLIRSRDICNHLHLMLHAEVGSRTELHIFRQCWEIMDGLERALLGLADIVFEEIVPFGESSLATWGNSCKRLSQLYSELTAPPFNACDIRDSVHRNRDRYFDDCSWSSLILVSGIEVPIRSMYASEEGIPIEAQNVIDRLNYLVNEMKLNGDIDEWIRELCIGIISDTAAVTMKGPETASLDFWNAASRALYAIDLEKRLDQDMVDSLHRPWGGFAEDWIRPMSISRSQIPANSGDSIPISPREEITGLGHKITGWRSAIQNTGIWGEDRIDSPRNLVNPEDKPGLEKSQRQNRRSFAQLDLSGLGADASPTAKASFSQELLRPSVQGQPSISSTTMGRSSLLLSALSRTSANEEQILGRMPTQHGSQGLHSMSPPSSLTEASENLWEKFHNFFRANKMPFDKVEINTGNDSNPSWLVTIRVRDRSWTNSRPERTKILAKENVVRLVLNDWATQPELFSVPFPPFGRSVVGTHSRWSAT